MVHFLNHFLSFSLYRVIGKLTAQESFIFFHTSYSPGITPSTSMLQFVLVWCFFANIFFSSVLCSIKIFAILLLELAFAVCSHPGLSFLNILMK